MTEMYCILNTETQELIIGPGTGVDEVHESIDAAQAAKQELAEQVGTDDHLQIHELVPVDDD